MLLALTADTTVDVTATTGEITLTTTDSNVNVDVGTGNLNFVDQGSGLQFNHDTYSVPVGGIVPIGTKTGTLTGLNVAFPGPGAVGASGGTVSITLTSTVAGLIPAGSLIFLSNGCTDDAVDNGYLLTATAPTLGADSAFIAFGKYQQCAL